MRLKDKIEQLEMLSRQTEHIEIKDKIKNAIVWTRYYSRIDEKKANEIADSTTIKMSKEVMQWLKGKIEYLTGVKEYLEGIIEANWKEFCEEECREYEKGGWKEYEAEQRQQAAADYAAAQQDQREEEIEDEIKN